jgi:hypothetical protein
VERGHVARRQPNQEFTVQASMYGKVCLRHGQRLHRVPARHTGQQSTGRHCKAWPIASAMRPKKTRMLRAELATWTTTIDIAWHGMTPRVYRLGVYWSRIYRLGIYWLGVYWPRIY